MKGINMLHHIGMSVPSLDEARSFYVDVLGFEELGAGEFERDPEIDRIMGLKDSAARAVYLRLGDAKIEMFEFSAPAQGRGSADRPVHLHGFTHICLDVTDVLGLHARLAEAGMSFHSAPVEKMGVRTVYGRDPFGNVIELQEIVTADPTDGEILPNDTPAMEGEAS
ncbi:VOC family protein [Novosphingobium sp. G106]|uniref:VOC family protein n=1 Tax=Novosphingobium sp. G106 TaxID=2849500 RepID=UPI001C2D70CC|nr:VOC family protein [Novosphingobium sp. G106]MBV1688979.1 VOC family protein [Novosphingobium sp. G106]